MANFQRKNQENLLKNQENKNSNKKYVCGCGKTYTSYPAYSTHRKTKHQNINIQGSVIPKIQNTKRGRPSYEFKKNQYSMKKIKNFYKGLTVIETGLLKINEKNQKKIIAQSSQQNKFQIPKSLVNLAELDSCFTKGEHFQINENILQIQNKKNTFIPKLMVLFIELMTTHMTKFSAQALIQFIAQFTRYLIQNLQSRDQKQDQDQDQLFDIKIFNMYFSKIENKQFINKLNEFYQLPCEFFVDFSIILSHWFYKIGICSKVIRVRD